HVTRDLDQRVVLVPQRDGLLRLGQSTCSAADPGVWEEFRQVPGIRRPGNRQRPGESRYGPRGPHRVRLARVGVDAGRSHDVALARFLDVDTARELVRQALRVAPIPDVEPATARLVDAGVGRELVPDGL